MFTWCVHPVSASARRPAAVLEKEGRSSEDRKKAEKAYEKAYEKAKIHVGSQMVIGRQTAALGHYSFLTRELRVKMSNQTVAERRVPYRASTETVARRDAP